jgi:hypothetical protein
MADHRVGEIIWTPWGYYKAVLGTCHRCEIGHLCGSKTLRYFGVCSAIVRDDDNQICWIKCDKEERP